jgi:uncharacterized protein YjdB
MVYFANGIANDADASLAGAYATQNLIGPTFGGQPIQYGRIFHNQTSVGNIQTVLLQKLQTDPSWSWATGSILSQIVLDAVNGLPLPNSIQQFLPSTLQNQLVSTIASLSDQSLEADGIPGNGYYDSQVARDVLQYLGSLQQGLEVLVVAHSQGNLYADAAYHQLFADGTNSDLQSAFAVASVATPDIGTVSTISGAPAYITSANDLVIGGLHLVFPAVLPPTDGNHVFNLTPPVNCLFSSTLPDCSGHAYIGTYLNFDLPYRSSVLAVSNALIGALTTGSDCTVSALQISPPSPIVLVGSTVTLVASATNAAGLPVAVPQSLLWVSLDDSIASVVSGVVTGVAQGDTTISVTDSASGVTASTSVTVSNVILKLSPPSLELAVGETDTLTVSATDASGNSITVPANLTWRSSADSVASVSAGVVLAVSVGTAMITVTDSASTAFATSTVNVVSPVPTVTLTADPATVTSGNSSTLTWSSTNATSCTATGGWTSSTATSGTASTGALTATTTYAMTCSDANGNVSVPGSVTVTVQALATPWVGTWTGTLYQPSAPNGRPDCSMPLLTFPAVATTTAVAGNQVQFALSVNGVPDIGDTFLIAAGGSTATSVDGVGDTLTLTPGPSGTQNGSTLRWDWLISDYPPGCYYATLTFN